VPFFLLVVPSARGLHRAFKAVKRIYSDFLLKNTVRRQHHGFAGQVNLPPSRAPARPYRFFLFLPAFWLVLATN
jgi:hypothetical protein